MMTYMHLTEKEWNMENWKNLYFLDVQTERNLIIIEKYCEVNKNGVYVGFLKNQICEKFENHFSLHFIVICRWLYYLLALHNFLILCLYAIW